LEVKASFALSYKARNPIERAVFRLISLIKAPTFPGWVAATLLGDPGAHDTDGRRARDAINGLVEAHLLECMGPDRIGQLRYRFHQLLYLFAAERLAEEEKPASQQLALQRLLVAYLDLAQQALEHLQPGESPSIAGPVQLTSSTTSIPDRTLHKVQENPLTWFTVEREALLSAILVAHERKEWLLCVLLADAMLPYLELRALWDDWRRASDLALDAAIQSGNRLLLAQAKRNVGDLLRDQRQWKDAGELFEECLQLYRDLGERRGEARTMQSVGNLCRDQGDWQGAIGWYEQCIPILESLGDRRGRASALYDISVAYRNDGDWERAIAGFQVCLEVFQELGDLRSQASTWRGVGVAHRNRWQWPEAIECLERALRLFPQIGDRRGFARTLANRADVYQEQKQWKEGIADLEACLSIHQELGDVRLQADSLRRMSVLYRKKGEPRKALKLLNDPGCLPLLGSLDEHRWHHYAMHNLGEAFLGLKRLPEARELFEECLPYFEGRGEGRRDRLWEAKTLHGLGAVLAQGSPQEQRQVDEILARAFAIFRDLGSPEADEVEERRRRLHST
jgi:tetratricopeptide (TPR) repeat protein